MKNQKLNRILIESLKKMKFIVGLYSLLFVVNCNNKEVKNESIKANDMLQPYDTVMVNNSEDSIIPSNDDAINDEIKNFSDFKEFKIYKLTDTIREDFNGDGIKDQVYLKNEQNGIIVMFIDGSTTKKDKITPLKPFEDMLKDVSWVNYWGTTRDSIIGETLIEDDEIAEGRDSKVDNISIFFRKLEVGGGVITYNNKLKKFIWLHQSC